MKLAAKVKNPIKMRRGGALVCVVASSAIALAICMYVCLVETGLSPQFLSHLFSLRFIPVFVICILFGLAFHFKGSAMAAFLFEYRWVIACVLWMLCVMFQLSGSSIGLMMEGIGVDGAPIYGVNRAIRSDEWSVFTPMALSQSTQQPSYPYFQDSFRGTETDMFLLYGQPVWSIAVIFRPFQVGYLLLGPSYGLSFFWCGRLIILFMTSFEFAFRWITKEKKALAVAYASMIAFSSLVQWWFSVNGLVEMLLFGQLALIWAQLYLRSRSYIKRLLYSLGIAWCLGVFVLTVYPAWQIPFAYIFLALLAALLIKELPTAQKSWKDIVLCLIPIAILGVLVAYVFLGMSAETIKALMGTEYPGNRGSAGGDYIGELSLYPFAITESIFPDSFRPSVCVWSSFYTLLPLSLALPLAIMIKERKPDALTICLLSVSALLLVYAIIGFPELLAKATLLDKSFANRVVSACGFAFVILLFNAVSRQERWSKRAAIGMVSISFILAAIAPFFSSYEISKKHAVVAFIVMLILMILAVLASDEKRRRVFAVACIVVSFLSGALVNPLRAGIDHYFDNDTAEMVASVDEDDLWMVVDTDEYVGYNNYLPSIGVRTINSTNTYPQNETWEKANGEERFRATYNRYAHIGVDYQGTYDVPFWPKANDFFTLSIDTKMLHDLGVTKLLFLDDGEEDLRDHLDCQLVAQNDVGKVYEVL